MFEFIQSTKRVEPTTIAEPFFTEQEMKEN